MEQAFRRWLGERTKADFSPRYSSATINNYISALNRFERIDISPVVTKAMILNCANATEFEALNAKIRSASNWTECNRANSGALSSVLNCVGDFVAQGKPGVETGEAAIASGDVDPEGIEHYLIECLNPECDAKIVTPAGACPKCGAVLSPYTCMLWEMVQRGDTEAMYRFACMYEWGRGVVQDRARALELYVKSAEAGNANAQYELGRILIDGDWVERDVEEGIRLLETAAAQNHVVAMSDLACFYSNGKFIEVDVVRVAEWARKAAELGDAENQFKIGYMYEMGEGVEVDRGAALAWYKKAVKQGNANAQYNLGQILTEGAWVERNDEQAYRLFKSAAEQGHAGAMTKLACGYAIGCGVEKDFVRAAEWMLNAAELGDGEAQAKMGYMYEMGHGVEADRSAAIAWYTKAAEQGYPGAEKALQQLSKEEGEDEEEDKDEGMLEPIELSNQLSIPTPWQSMDEGAVWVSGPYVFAFQKEPKPLLDTLNEKMGEPPPPQIMKYHYVMSVFYNRELVNIPNVTKPIVVAGLEQTNLEELEKLSVEDGRKRKKLKEKMGSVMIGVFIANEHRNYGEYPEKLTQESAQEILFGVVTNILDLDDDVVYVGTFKQAKGHPATGIPGN